MKPAYWYRVPGDSADEAVLMALTHAQLKCYLVVARAIQRDRNGGKISARQVATRAQLGLRHAFEALNALAKTCLLTCDAKPGATAVYSLPVSWITGDCSPVGEQLNQAKEPNCIPTGKQSAAKRSPVGKQSEPSEKPGCSPVGKQHCSPVGEQHSESSEKHTRTEDSERLKQPARAATSEMRSPQGNEFWPRGGWDSAEDFETWFARLVWKHPNKNRNAVAKAKAIEFLMAGNLNRAEFEAGYEALRAAAGVRWTEENGHYAPNLWQLLEDRAWKFAPDAATPMPAAPAYQSADDYVRRLQAE